jgi:PAS domain S-box-containing protein
MKAIVQDYVFKAVDKLSGIVRFVRRSKSRRPLITEQKQGMEAFLENEEFARRIIDSSNDCIKVLDLEGRILSMSSAGQKLLEIEDSESYLNLPWLDFWKIEDRETAQLAVNLARNDGVGIFRGYCETAKGTPKWWEVVITPIKDSFGNIERLLAVSRDTTAQKNAEHELLEKQLQLEELNHALELKIEERTKDLQQQLNFTQTLLNAIPIPVYYKNIEGKYIGCNKAYEDFRGITTEDLYGKSVFDIAMPADAKAIHEIDSNLLNSHESRQYMTSITRKDGTRREVVYHKASFTDSTGEIAGSIGVIQDITELKMAEKEIKNYSEVLEERVLERTRSLEDANNELIAVNSELELRRREAEESREKLQQLSSAVVHSPVAVIIIGYLGKIEYVNPKFTEITGYFPEEAIGRTPRMLTGTLPEDCFKGLRETVIAGEEWRGELCNRKKSGDLLWEHILISPLKDECGNITHFIVIMDDITEQKRIAEELLVAQEAADTANRFKSEFLANMSHEIRTPLNAIIGFSTMILKAGMPPRQQDYLRKINMAGELLLNIINDILDLSKIEAGRLNMEQIPFVLDKTIANSIALVQDKAVEKKIRLNIDVAPETPRHLLGDPLRLNQILSNLLSNAVKFTDKGEITLTVSPLESGTDKISLLFKVRDTGIGLSPDQKAILFMPFTQGDGSTTRRFGGTGLGLSICSRLVEIMGGEIKVESELGKGSTFIFTANFGLLEQASLSADTILQTETGLDFNGAHILLVDDNEANRQLAIELLEQHGFIIDVANNGKEALAMVKEGEEIYDLVLMDVQMPEMDGYETTRRIRSDDRFASLPIIAMTAHALEEERLKCIAFGMNDHIAKPINSHQMFAIIERHIKLPSHESRTGKDNRKKLPQDTGAILMEDTAIPTISGIDVSDAIYRMGGNKPLFISLLQLFIDTQADSAASIKKALDEGDVELALRMAHTSLGAAGNIGASGLENAADTLEKAIRENSRPEYISNKLDKYKEELEELLETLRKVLPELSLEEQENDNGAQIDILKVTLAMKNLHDYILKSDGKAIDYLYEHRPEFAGLPKTALRQLEHKLADFDYDTSLEILIGLAEEAGISI